MATQKRDQAQPKDDANKKDMAHWRPGSEPSAAGREVGGEGDFGVPAGAGSGVDRDYVSHNTKASDPGNAQAADWEHDGVRDHGAGAPDSGPGSGSGGDVDTDIIGLGAGGSTVSVSGPDDRGAGPDDTDGSSKEFAGRSPARRQGDAVIEPASGRNQAGVVGKVGGSKVVKGSTVQRPAADQDAQGSDAATNPGARGDDSFEGEVSSGEARGDDRELDPGSDPRDA